MNQLKEKKKKAGAFVFKEKLNASRPYEHPPVGRGMCQNICGAYLVQLDAILVVFDVFHEGYQ